ncbi:hypothetical protein BHE74_00005930 [Ensete ventricosum]|nr:hypothetical protein BHE74_00005930 [Ensete ventricosum]RZS16688.1 hypothetical protein BHM03_00048722 [Ensete ventricosum]
MESFSEAPLQIPRFPSTPPTLARLGSLVRISAFSSPPGIEPIARVLYAGRSVAMRLIGEISYVRNEEDKENEGVPPMSLPPPPQQTLVVGFALTSKKVKSFFQPKLEALARYAPP